MSDVGGVFGLYIGLTLVGFIELLEMGLMSGYYWYLAQRHRHNRTIHFGQAHTASVRFYPSNNFSPATTAESESGRSRA